MSGFGSYFFEIEMHNLNPGKFNKNETNIGSSFCFKFFIYLLNSKANLEQFQGTWTGLFAAIYLQLEMIYIFYIFGGLLIQVETLKSMLAHFTHLFFQPQLMCTAIIETLNWHQSQNFTLFYARLRNAVHTYVCTKRQDQAPFHFISQLSKHKNVKIFMRVFKFLRHKKA